MKPGEEPSFTWFKGGAEFDPDERFKVLFKDEEDTLAQVFQHINQEEAGLYRCVANTSGGKIACSAKLTVEGTVSQMLKAPEPPMNPHTAFICRIIPWRPNIKWTKDGKPLKAGDRHKFVYPESSNVKEDSKHAFSELMKKVDSAKQLHGPVYMEGEVKVKHCFNQIEKHADNIKLMAGPIYLSEQAKYSFSEIQKQVESLKTLSGPVYVDEKCNFNEIMKTAESFKTLNGPVYVRKGERYNFNELLPMPDSLKPMAGPVYMTGDSGHHFNEVMDKVKGLKDLSGPVYLDENTRHQYSEFIKGVEVLKTISYPVCLSGDNKHNLMLLQRVWTLSNKLVVPSISMKTQSIALVRSKKPLMELNS